MIPIEDWVKNLLSSNFDVTGLFSVFNDVFIAHIFNLFGFSIKVKFYLFIVDIFMISGGELFSFSHSPLLSEEVQLAFILLLFSLKIRLLIFIVYVHLAPVFFLFRLLLVSVSNFLYGIEEELFKLILIILLGIFGLTFHYWLWLSYYK